MGEDLYKPLLMGYLDEELTELEAQRVERHLEECAECREELDGFRKLKEATLHMRVTIPPDKYWEDYWSRIYNRLERRVGWIFFSIGAIMLTAFGLYQLIVTLLLGSGIPLFVRVGVIALVIGISTLLVSVVRERLFLIKSDKYERIKR